MNIALRLLPGCFFCLSALCAAPPALADVTVGETCSALGTSMMTTDQKNIATCLKNDSGVLVWKSMTSSGAKFTIIQNSSSWTGPRPNITAHCPDGYTLIGGSCDYYDTDQALVEIYSHPNPDGSGWQCNTGDGTRYAKAYAFCASTE